MPRFIIGPEIGRAEPQGAPQVNYAAWRRRIDELAAVIDNQHAEHEKLKLKKKLQPKQPRALPNGRLKNVKLGDIIKAYERKDRRNRYVMIDFRPPRLGEYYLDKSFSIEKVIDRDDLASLKGGARIILEFVRDEPREEPL